MAAYEPNEKVIVWGDSLAKGVVWNEERRRHTTADSTAVDVAADKLGITIENRARFGFTATRGFETMQRDLNSGVTCDAALLEFGGNDCNFDWAAISENPDAAHEPATPPAAFVKTLTNMVHMLMDKHIRPVLMTLPPIDAERYFRYLVGDKLNGANILKWLGDVQQIYRFQELYSRLVEKVALSTRCKLIDIRSHCLGDHRMAEYICADGLHLTEAGQRFVGETASELLVEGE